MKVYVGDAVVEADVGLAVEERQRTGDVSLVAKGYVARLRLRLLDEYLVEIGKKTEQDVENCLTYLDKMNDEDMRILADYGLEGRDHEINEEGYIVDLLADKEIQEKPEIGLNQSVAYVPDLPDMKTVEKSDRLIEEEAIKAANVDIAVFNPASGYLVSSKINAEVGTDLKDILDRARTQYICGQIDENGLQEQFKVWEQRGGADLITEINEMYQADQTK